MPPSDPCPECGSTEHLEVRNYSVMWHDGDVVCTNVAAHKSGETVYVRNYDTG